VLSRSVCMLAIRGRANLSECYVAFHETSGCVAPVTPFTTIRYEIIEPYLTRTSSCCAPQITVRKLEARWLILSLRNQVKLHVTGSSRLLPH